MSAQENWSVGPGHPGGGNAVLRRVNGSIDIAAYAAIAHRQRTAAIASSMLSAGLLIRDAWAVIAVRRAPKQTAAGKPCG